jgi:DNA-binding response OmpR family regulator
VTTSREPTSAERAQQAAKTVLIVEDEAALASALSYNLLKNGLTVLHAADGVAGLHMARSERPDIIVLDLRGRTVHRDGAEVQLKPKEFDLLYFLARNAGQVFTREQLLERVWGYEFFGGSRTVDVHIRWLREKLEAEPGSPRHLLTVRGVGYKFVR